MNTSLISKRIKKVPYSNIIQKIPRKVTVVSNIKDKEKNVLRTEGTIYKNDIIILFFMHLIDFFMDLYFT